LSSNYNNINDYVNDLRALLLSFAQRLRESVNSFALPLSRTKEMDIFVTVMEARVGTKKTLVLKRGKNKTERLVISVPPRIENGKKLRLKGKGLPGFLGMPPGDVLLRINIKE